MVFSRRHKYEKPDIFLNGKKIEYVETFKYLGVIFDRKLNWSSHAKAQVKKAKAAMMVGRRMVGKHWGLTPKITHWLYTAIVRPILLYGSVVWTPCLKKKGIINALTKVQRLACKMMTFENLYLKTFFIYKIQFQSQL